MPSSVRIQRNIAFLAVFLFIIKIIAWRWTHSVAIFTDAMESIVNVVAGLIGWYSVWLAAKPRDRNHPYGHGKVEFISASIEGTLIIIAGLIIIYEAILKIKHPQQIQKLDWGLILIGFTAVLNYGVGSYAVKHGLSKRSMAVEAAGRHLKTDTYSTGGVIIGLALMWVTGWYWLDTVIALVIAFFILYTGYKVIRKSLAGIMDEADIKLLDDLIRFLNQNRRPSWIDLHNLRMVQYGKTLHLDGHITLPWYYTVRQAHDETEALTLMIRQQFGNAIELFLHVDYCEDFSCKICFLKDCQVRRHAPEKRIQWTTENVLQDRKHQIN